MGDYNVGLRSMQETGMKTENNTAQVRTRAAA